jgi:Short C-terminal domain
MASSSYDFRVSAPSVEAHSWLRGRGEKSGEIVADGSETEFTAAWHGSCISPSEAPALMQFEIREAPGNASLVSVTVETELASPLDLVHDYADPLGKSMSHLKAAGDVARDARGLTAKVAIDELPKAVRKVVRQHVAPAEVIDFAFWGNSNQTLVAFRDRILILKPGHMANATFGCRATTFYYGDITGLQFTTGWVTGIVQISTPSYPAHAADYWQSAGKGVDGRAQSPFVIPTCIPCNKECINRWRPYLDELRKRISASKPGQPAAAAPAAAVRTPAAPTADPLDQLRRLAELRDSGVLTDKEFDAKKVEILARI